MGRRQWPLSLSHSWFFSPFQTAQRCMWKQLNHILNTIFWQMPCCRSGVLFCFNGWVKSSVAILDYWRLRPLHSYALHGLPRYSFTLVASIGYGDMTPHTDGGRIFCILFTWLSSMAVRLAVECGDSWLPMCGLKGCQKGKKFEDLGSKYCIYFSSLVFLCNGSHCISHISYIIYHTYMLYIIYI